MSDLVRARERVKYAEVVVKVVQEDAARSAMWHAQDIADAQAALREAHAELERLAGEAA